MSDVSKIEDCIKLKQAIDAADPDNDYRNGNARFKLSNGVGREGEQPWWFADIGLCEFDDSDFDFRGTGPTPEDAISNLAKELQKIIVS